jgi:beta-lactamase regulating signal transducer with metallopeptidase domain
MIDLANTFDAVARNVLLQSTVIFLTGMLIARFFVRRPARIHTVLELAFMAAIVAPLASEAARRSGWGLLPPEPALAANRVRPIALTAVTPTSAKPADEAPRSDRLSSSILPGATAANPIMVDNHSPASASQRSISRATSAPYTSQTIRVESATADSPRAVGARGLFFVLTAVTWPVVSVFLACRLLSGMIAGRRILRSATACKEPAVAAAVAAASDRLNMNQVRIDVCQSSSVHCPMIWCWGARPRLLLPIDSARNWSAATWTPILCHELAHWKRRDHWAALVPEVVCCLMPWQVMAWWAKRRLELASEQACDDWAMAVGHSAVDYAETLLGLVAQADPPLALAAVRRRSGLGGRIEHILSQTVPHPRLGRLWAVVVLLITVTTVGVMAVCQRGVARADSPTATVPSDATKKTDKSEEPKPDKKEKPAEIAPGKPAASMLGKGMATSTAAPGGRPIPPVAPNDASDQVEHFRVSGKVLTADDKPIADAEVYWDLAERPLYNQGEWPAPRSVSQAQSGVDGAFAIEAEFSRKRMSNQFLVVRAPGFGVTVFHRLDLGKLSTPVEIRLEPSAPIEGSIFTPDGVPVANARVAIGMISRGNDAKEGYNGWYLGLTVTESMSDQPRAYWPAAVTTDAQGKFRIDDATPRRSAADLLVDAPDYPRTSVSVRHPDSLMYNLQTTYRESNFMLVLESPYVVNGRFVDEKTGAPIAKARVVVSPHTNNRSTLGGYINAVSDADGRYEMRVGSAELYFVKVFPPLGYPGVQTSLSARQINQLAGPSRKLKYEVKLRPGIVLKGRVVDAETEDGVVGAQVYYKPESGRKPAANNEFFPITTADDGTFEAAALDGKGFFLIDAPGKGFYRLAVQDSRIGRYREGLYPHGMLEIDVPAEGQNEPYVIKLKRGSKLELRALASDGKPVQQLRAACAETSYEGFFSGEDVQDGVFRLDAAELGRKYRVFLNCESAKAGGVFEVEAPADGKPIDVTLQPWATIRGRYVYDGGIPAPEVTNFTRFRLYSEREPEGNASLNLPFYDNFSGHQHTKRVTDADGNFELDGMIPGAFIYLNLNNEFAGGKRNYEIGVLKPGEVKDVGALVIHANR